MEEKKTFKDHWDHLKMEVDTRLWRVGQWIKENKEVLVVVIPVGCSLIGTVVKAASKYGHDKDERELKDEYIYDRSNGHYFRVKRKLTSAEWLEVDQRRANGELLGQILLDMRVLK